MTEVRSRLRASLLVAGLVAFALVTMEIDRRAGLDGERDLPWWSGAILDAAAPVQKALSLPVDAARDAWRRYVDLIGVGEQNRELRERLARAEEENLQLREALVASGRLERIAEMREQFETPMLPSQLVGIDASPWFRSVLLDRGRDHAVRSGMPVISEHGLVGLVTATSRIASRVMVVLDRQSAVDGVVQRSRTRGIVRGRAGDELEFEFVVRGSDVRTGDLLLTSGLDGVYPKGLRIGEIISLSQPDARLLRTATVAPAVDFGRLEQVFVMLRRGPTMELLYASEERGAAPPAEEAAP